MTPQSSLSAPSGIVSLPVGTVADRSVPWYRRAAEAGAEAAVAVTAAATIARLAQYIRVNPMIRIGQVSGLAAVQLRLMLIMGALLLLLPLARRVGRYRLGLRLVAGAFSGLATGALAGGIVIALRGTPWPLNGQYGDAGQLQTWAEMIQHGQPIAAAYPPAVPHLIATYADLFQHGQNGTALKILEIAFTALAGPAAYLAWRMLLPPLWALGIGGCGALVLVDPYKPYTAVVLLVMVPALAKLFQLFQQAVSLTRRQALLRGAWVGALCGVLFLVYSGWFVWSALGTAVAAVAVLTHVTVRAGRRALLTALLGAGAAAAAFAVVAGWYVVALLGASGTTVDRYCYFDVEANPTYFAMWRDDMPGTDALGSWPPSGELAGVGVFTLLLLVGLALAIAFGRGRATVAATLGCLGSAVVMRYWFASHMEQDQAVQLYPRTSQQMLYCFLILCGLAGLYGYERWSRSRADRPLAARRLPGLWSALGVLAALGFLFGSAASLTSDRFMPQPPKLKSAGQLAWDAQQLSKPDGTCPTFAPNARCAGYVPDLVAAGLNQPPAPVQTTIDCNPQPPTKAKKAPHRAPAKKPSKPAHHSSGSASTH